MGNLKISKKTRHSAGRASLMRIQYIRFIMAKASAALSLARFGNICALENARLEVSIERLFESASERRLARRPRTFFEKNKRSSFQL